MILLEIFYQTAVRDTKDKLIKWACPLQVGWTGSAPNNIVILRMTYL